MKIKIDRWHVTAFTFTLTSPKYIETSNTITKHSQSFVKHTRRTANAFASTNLNYKRILCVRSLSSFMHIGF